MWRSESLLSSRIIETSICLSWILYKYVAIHSSSSDLPIVINIFSLCVVGGEDPKTRSAERRCEPGFYCQNGIQRLCPAGTYGSTFGLQFPNCTGNCAPGYYCPEGSISATEIMCGDPSRYCPGSSPRPLNVSIGWYTIGGNESTRIGQAIAPRGYYALKGLLYPCPAGYYGAEEGMSSPQCSGMCFVDGYYCPGK